MRSCVAELATEARPSSAPGKGGLRNKERMVIHIGLQKTGTTFLQRSLDSHRAAMAAHGLIYPQPAVGLKGSAGTAHHFLAHAVLDRRRGHTPAVSFDQLEHHIAALQAACADAATQPGGALLISSEDFSLFRLRHIRRLRALFPDQDIRILVYLRRQDEWLEAMYGQVLKQGRSPEPDDFIEQNRQHVDYAALLAPWAKVFGDSNLIVRTYEGFTRGGLWADFCTALDRPQAASIVADEVQVNVSLSREASMFLSRIRNDRWRHTCRLALEGSQEPERQSGLRYLSPARARQIMADHQQGNAQVAARYLGRAQLFHDTAPLKALPRPSWLMRHLRLLGQLLPGLIREARRPRRPRR